MAMECSRVSGAAAASDVFWSDSGTTLFRAPWEVGTSMQVLNWRSLLDRRARLDQ
jgi:hypothetical protein